MLNDASKGRVETLHVIEMMSFNERALLGIKYCDVHGMFVVRDSEYCIDIRAEKIVLRIYCPYTRRFRYSNECKSERYGWCRPECKCFGSHCIRSKLSILHKRNRNVCMLYRDMVDAYLSCMTTTYMLTGGYSDLYYDCVKRSLCRRYISSVIGGRRSVLSSLMSQANLEFWSEL